MLYLCKEFVNQKFLNALSIYLKFNDIYSNNLVLFKRKVFQTLVEFVSSSGTIYKYINLYIHKRKFIIPCNKITRLNIVHIFSFLNLFQLMITRKF